jgi:hypothetical protein
MRASQEIYESASIFCPRRLGRFINRKLQLRSSHKYRFSAGGFGGLQRNL